MYRILILIGACYFSCLPLSMGSDSIPSFIVKKTNAEIKIDGEMNEAEWKDADYAKDFYEWFPTDTTLARNPTEIYMQYDEDYLYVGIKCFSSGNDFLVNTLRRDYRAGGMDNITLLLDPFNDRTNAFIFGINPMGVVREGLLSGGGQDNSDFNMAWDNKWVGEAQIFEKYWAAEMKIPFKIMTFKDGSKSWGLGSYRFDTQNNEIHTWLNIPRNQRLYSLAFMGEMIWEEPLKKAGKSLALIPYTSGSVQNDFENNIKGNTDFGVGFDAKVSVGSGLKLDLTVNPDFSQVEVDRQVTNLSRFELFFPERRQFFIENSDLFGGFGFDDVNPFFSRRIGIAKDTLSGGNIENPIIVGARLSGKLNENWRIGLLNMQTAADESNGLPSFNYAVTAIQRKIAKRSNLGFIFANKQAFNYQEDSPNTRFNRVVGLDYNLASANNKWVGKAFYHTSLSPTNAKEHFGHGAALRYNTRFFEARYNHIYVGEGYNPEIGFVPRTNYFRVNQDVRLNFYPNKGGITNGSIGVFHDIFLKPGFGRTDQFYSLRFNARAAGFSGFDANLTRAYTYLTNDFDPSRTDKTPLPGDTDYTYTFLELSYNSNRNKNFFFDLRPTIGQFYNGFRTGIRGGFNYRIQPYGTLSINYSYNYINLPEPFARNVNLFLIGPRIDWTFSKDVFFNALVQYNTQIKNMNVNARFQWRFKPVSDLFIVYTDNYNTDNFSIRNRSLALKLTYWFNL